MVERARVAFLADAPTAEQAVQLANAFCEGASLEPGREGEPPPGLPPGCLMRNLMRLERVAGEEGNWLLHYTDMCQAYMR